MEQQLLSIASAAVTALAVGVRTKAVKNVLDLSQRHAAVGFSYTKFAVAGPSTPNLLLPGILSQDLARGLAGYADYFLTAHTLSSTASDLLLQDGIFVDFKRRLEEHEYRLDNEYYSLSLSYQTVYLALGIYHIVRFGDALQTVQSQSAESRAHELIKMADRLLQTTSDFESRRPEYDILGFPQLDGNCVQQLRAECVLNRAVTHRRLGTATTWADAGESQHESDLWRLTRINGEVIRSLIRDKPEEDAEFWLDQAANVCRSLTPSSDMKNHRYRMASQDSIKQAANSIGFARGYYHVLRAVWRLCDSWHLPKLPTSVDVTVRSHLALAHRYYTKDKAVWWHSYANLFLAWALLCYRRGDRKQFFRRMHNARNIYSQTHDYVKAAKIDQVVLTASLREMHQSDALLTMF